MGHEAARDEDWITVSIEYTKDMMIAAFFLRICPHWLHPIVAPLIPARRRIQEELRVAEKLVSSYTHNYDAANREGTHSEGALLEWMLDNAGSDKERSAARMAARQCVLTLASIHTTSMTAANVIFDLCTYPEWISVLRDEVISTIATYGRFDETSLNAASWLAKLEKMDSFIVESQRTNPAVLCKSFLCPRLSA